MGILIPFAYLLIPYMTYWRMNTENYAKLAQLGLFQAINDYQWAVRGFMTY